ncbi:unnamed protein product [Caenorhabditis auriculariae]|uniref:SH3 domain-containing protein n=1 Tax=Caenorhabditis auriculariae TaxID=2777116 RepID=A0A8S1HGW4_9PELO|nr:unnamed protein product [Caenorhabditis auriculariae]
MQALDEKSTDLEGDVSKARERIAEITKEIENMRGDRDEKVSNVQNLQKENQKLAIESQEMSHQLLHFQSAHKETSSRKTALEELRQRKAAIMKRVEEVTKSLEEEKSRKAKMREDLNQKEAAYRETVHSRLLTFREEYRKALELLSHAQKQAQTKLAELDAEQRQKREEEARNIALQAAASAPAPAPVPPVASFQQSHLYDEPPQVAPVATSNPVIPTSESRISSTSLTEINTHETSKCRAIFPFEARSEDELSFEPGDVIIVFQGHAAEPGWGAGQLRDKVGWFPEAFVEPIAAIPSHGNEPPIQNMPPNVTPSCSLDRIPEEGVMRKQDSVLSNISNNDASKKVICRCIAQFQWRARNEDDLSFSKGDTIDVFEQQDMKWNGRKSNGESGWFPKSYVKVISQNGSVDLDGSAHNSIDQISADLNSAHISNAAAPAPTQSGEWYVAVFDFEPVESTDLGLKHGDKILVTEKNDAWWKGVCNGKEGIFPANYVEPAVGSPVAASNGHQIVPNGSTCQARAIVDFQGTAPNQLTIKCGDVIEVREKSASGWWEGEIKQNGTPKRAGWFPGEYVKVIEGNQPTTMAENHAVALFDYEASQPDELSFKVGDIIVVAEKSDVEWWSGNKIQDVGATPQLFPANYVKLQ